MDIQLRSEMPGDEDAIDMVTCRAFESMNEANIIRLMRMYSPAFDPKYSITAWDGDQIVGHALFTPARVRLMDQTVAALALGPIAVLHERQRSGIGGQLTRYGHDLGRRAGFSLAFLNGHPSYYPRHGYRACFGFAKAKINTDKLPAGTRKFRRMPVRPDDVQWLAERHAAELAGVDFGWLWEPNVSEWTIPCLNTVMWWTDDGRRAAYTMGAAGRGDKLLLADDPELAREVIATLRPVALDHHPSGWLAQNVLDPEWSTCEAHPSDAAMAFELQDGILEPYMKAVNAGERPPGFVLFPLPFIAC